MNAVETARAIADPVGDVGARFMLSPHTYARGAELGFSDIDFYFCGRGGVLADAGSAAAGAEAIVDEFGFFEPDNAAAKYEQGCAVMALSDAANAFIGIGHDWGRARLPEQLDAGRLAELIRVVIDSASDSDDDLPELFLAWARQPWPQDDRGAALHGIHLLRELRGGLHLRAVRAEQLDPHAAAVVRNGDAGAEFPLGWQAPHPDPDQHRAAWERAEATTDDAMASLLGGLDEADRAELVELVLAAVPA